MGRINKSSWVKYLLATIAAIGMSWLGFIQKIPKLTLFTSDRNGVSGIRYCLWQVQVLHPIFSSVHLDWHSLIYLAKGINAFSEPDKDRRRHEGDRNALWFFLIAILSSWAMGLSNSLFGELAAELTNKLRSLSFRAILRQDGTSFYLFHLIPRSYTDNHVSRVFWRRWT